MLKGRVVSNKNLKTATVIVESKKTHPLYRKSFVHTKKYQVDDQIGVKVGDIVEFEKIRPISKMKHWRIMKVVGKDIIAMETEALKAEAKEAIEEVLPAEVEKPEEIVAETPEESVEEEIEDVKPKAKKTAVKKGSPSAKATGNKKGEAN